MLGRSSPEPHGPVKTCRGQCVSVGRERETKDAIAVSRQGPKLLTACDLPKLDGFIVARIVEKVVGKKLFDFVMGYPGGREYSLALRQGEVDGSGNSKGSFMDQLGDMWEAGKIVILAQAGTTEGKRDREFNNVPLITELAKTSHAKAIANSTSLLAHYGRPFTLPPGVPKERVKLLREAFWKVMQDEKLLKEAKKMRRPIRPVHGDKLQQMWKEALAAPPEAVELIKEIFGGK